MPDTLIENNRALWLNIRNFLFVATLDECIKERDLSYERGDSVRAELIERFIDREFNG